MLSFFFCVLSKTSFVPLSKSLCKDKGVYVFPFCSATGESMIGFKSLISYYTQIYAMNPVRTSFIVRLTLLLTRPAKCIRNIMIFCTQIPSFILHIKQTIVNETAREGRLCNTILIFASAKPSQFWPPRYIPESRQKIKRAPLYSKARSVKNFLLIFEFYHFFFLKICIRIYKCVFDTL